MPEWVIQTKLSPPAQSRELQPRSGLIERFDHACGQPLVLVRGAAGFGKTTALAQWREALQARGTPVAWLSLDDHDRQFFSFLSYLAAACRDAGFLRGRAFPQASADYAVLPDTDFASVLLTALARVAVPGVLILDDLHRVTGADDAGTEAVRFLSEMLSVMPAGFTLVLSTREVPAGLPLSELRLRDALYEFGQPALRFSAAEIDDYFAPHLKESESDPTSADLLARTEGWPVALRTIRRWLDDGASVADTLKQVSGRTLDLADYFVEQVFAELKVEEQQFLLCTALLERVNGDIAAALCPDVNGWQLLEALERRQTFVQCLDNQRHWFRYHRLFSEFLSERLRRDAPERIPTLHALAAQWFLQAGHAQEALQHAIASGDAALCGTLLEACGGWQYALKGHVALVQSALDLMQAQELARYPRVWLADVYLSARLGRYQHARRSLADLRASEPLLDARSDGELLGAEIEVMTELVRRYCDEPVTAQSIATLEALGERCPAQHHVLRAARANMLCAFYRDTGRFDDCLRIGDEAIAHYRAIESVYGEAFIYFHEGLACFAQARLRDAETLYRQGLELAEALFGDSSDLAAIARAFLSQVSYARNRLPEARSLLDGVLTHLEQADAWLEVYQAAYGTALRLCAAEGDHEGIHRLAGRALATARARNLPRLAYSTNLLCQLLTGPVAGRQGRAELGPAPAHPDAMSEQLAVLLEARAADIAGRSPDAIAVLSRAFDRATAAGRSLDAVELSIALAIAQQASGDEIGGMANLERALSLSMFESLKRPFIDAGAPLRALLSRMLGSTETAAARSNRLRDLFLAELRAEGPAESAAPTPLPGALSEREQAVLLHLLQGRSNREIGEALAVSINTIKFHLKNIYQKLDVSSRREAANAAIEQQLI
ncbi:MAG: LuxR C-terminal-related transcriptional regulator [Pseudomonadota bacterium]